MASGIKHSSANQSGTTIMIAVEMADPANTYPIHLSKFRVKLLAPAMYVERIKAIKEYTKNTMRTWTCTGRGPPVFCRRAATKTSSPSTQNKMILSVSFGCSGGSWAASVLIQLSTSTSPRGPSTATGRNAPAAFLKRVPKWRHFCRNWSIYEKESFQLGVPKQKKKKGFSM